MTKPRIIIADTDRSYIVPIQLKFVEDFFDMVELEIITDQDYFTQLFSSPQRADILIVSEELYDSSLSRHNIEHIFLMMEQYEEESTAELSVTCIYKYTSIKEIFNVIIGKGELGNGVSPNNDPQIVLICSASGGVGKTTIALGICGALTRDYKKVLYLNACRLQSFQRMLKNNSAIISNDVYSVLSSDSRNYFEDIKHVFRKELFTYLPPFKAALMSLGIEYSVFAKIAAAAKKSEEFDYIVVDTDSSFDEDLARLMGIADKVLVVSNQSATSVLSTNVLVENINGVENDKYIFVCNDFRDDEDNALISPEITPKFAVSEYVEHIPHYDSAKCDEFAVNRGIQKISVLLV